MKKKKIKYWAIYIRWLKWSSSGIFLLGGKKIYRRFQYFSEIFVDESVGKEIFFPGKNFQEKSESNTQVL